MTVHVVATGGTISSHHDGTGWTNLTGAELVAELGPLPVDVEVHDVAAGPSSNLSVDDMERIAVTVRELLAGGAEGVVVIHGTDTMELTAFVTQLLLGTDATRRAVVFTGSMRVHSHPQPDGTQNLRDAIAVATSPAAVGREVLVCLEGALHAADRVHKVNAASVDAFTSYPFEPVGAVRGSAVTFLGPAPVRPAAPGLHGPVPLVVCHPGIAADAVPAGTPGLVVAGFGDLNVPHDLWAPMLTAAGAGALVALASQVFAPNAGDADLHALGAVGAGGLSPQKARLAVMAALAAAPDRDTAIDFLHQYALPFDAGDRSTTA